MTTVTEHDLTSATLRQIQRDPAHPMAHLSEEDIREIGEAFDAIRQRILDDLGEEDAAYIRRIVRLQRALEVGGRASLFLSFLPPFFVAGAGMLGVAKILDNMEIGHNVMHGQYDWMGDPALQSSQFEWDTAAPSANWRHGHNVVHHTWTNVIGKDRDIGYGVLRMTDEQRWRVKDLGNPVYAFLLAVFFQWGVALHDLEVENLRSGKTKWEDVSDFAKLLRSKAKKQALKDYVLFPLLALPVAPLVFLGNATANLIRNLWAFTIIFCGHFPDGTMLFTEEDIEDESRGHWYVRQLLGSANIEGGQVFHVMSGNLSHQIEHHLFPDLPAWRYNHVAPDVRAICEQYGLEYNTGSLGSQFGQVVRRICKLALPWTKDDGRLATA